MIHAAVQKDSVCLNFGWTILQFWAIFFESLVNIIQKSCRWEIVNRSRSQSEIPRICYECCYNKHLKIWAVLIYFKDFKKFSLLSVMLMTGGYLLFYPLIQLYSLFGVLSIEIWSANLPHSLSSTIAIERATRFNFSFERNKKKSSKSSVNCLIYLHTPLNMYSVYFTLRTVWKFVVASMKSILGILISMR